MPKQTACFYKAIRQKCMFLVLIDSAIHNETQGHDSCQVRCSNASWTALVLTPGLAFAFQVVHLDRTGARAKGRTTVRSAARKSQLPARHRCVHGIELVVTHGSPHAGIINLQPAAVFIGAIHQADAALHRSAYGTSSAQQRQPNQSEPRRQQDPPVATEIEWIATSHE